MSEQSTLSGARTWRGVKVAFGIFLAVATLGVIFAATPAPALAVSDPWTISQLTNNRWQDYQVVADGTRAAWVRDFRSELDPVSDRSPVIVLRDLTSGGTTLIDSKGSNADYGLRLSGDLVVWQVTDGQDFKIMAYSISDATTTMVADTGGSDAKPVVGDGLIAWSASDGHDREIFVYDAATKLTRQVTNNEYDDIDPSISGGLVAWVGIMPVPGSTLRPDGREGSIFVYNVAGGATTQIGRQGLDEEEVAIDGARVLFSGRSGQGDTLYLYSVTDATTSQLSERGSGAGHFTMAGDYAVWLTPGSNQLWNLYLYQFSTKTTKKLAANGTADAPPHCSGSTVVWQGWQGLDWEIFAYDIASGGTSWLINVGGVNKSPVTTGYRVLWVGNDGHDDEIFQAVPASVAPSSQFSDVSGMAPYRTAILDLGGRGVVNGVMDGIFRPGADLWRAQFAKMIVGAFSIAVDESMKPTQFTDLGYDDPGKLYPHQYIAAAAANGIIKGITPSTFSPYTNVTRAQVVTMIVRAAQALHPGLLVEPPAWEPGPLPTWIDEAHAQNWRLAWYNGLLAGLIGYGPGSDPYEFATRGEVAQMLWNYLGLD